MTIYKKLYKILSISQRKKIVSIFFMMLFSMMLEMVGIGVIIPVLAFMSKTNISTNYPVLQPVLSFFGKPTQEMLIIICMVTLGVLYVIKTIFLGCFTWIQNLFVYNLSASLSSRLFCGYLRQPWTFHLQRNSAQLILNVTNEVSLLTSTLQSCMVLISDGLVLLGIIILLGVVEPFGTLIIVSALGLVVWAFHYIIKNKLSAWGEARQNHEGLKIQHLQQGFGGAKDVKLLGRENEFSEQFDMHTAKVASITAKIKTLSDLNRLWLELLGMIGLILLVIVMIIQGTPPAALLPTMGLFAVAAFKLLPSINRMTGGIQNARYLLPAINKVYDEMQLVDISPIQYSNEVLTFKHHIGLECIDYQYKNATTNAVQSVKIQIKNGTSVGIIGTSGAGKSTLVDIILGLLPPDIGYVKVDGIDIQTNLRSWQNQVGYVPQSIFLTDDTIRRNIAFGVPESEIDDIAVQRSLKASQLENFVKNLPKGMDTLVGERGVRLSGGQRQRIGIARALYHNPTILVLDEATSSLDLSTEKEVMEAVNALQGDKTIIIVAHRLSTLSNCDLLYKLENGRVIQEGSFSFVANGA